MVSFVRICVDDIIPKDDGDSLVLSLCLFKVVKSSLCADGQIKVLSSPFRLPVNHKIQVEFNGLDTRLAGVVVLCYRTRGLN